MHTSSLFAPALSLPLSPRISVLSCASSFCGSVEDRPFFSGRRPRCQNRLAYLLRVVVLEPSSPSPCCWVNEKSRGLHKISSASSTHISALHDVDLLLHFTESDLHSSVCRSEWCPAQQHRRQKNNVQESSRHNQRSTVYTAVPGCSVRVWARVPPDPALNTERPHLCSVDLFRRRLHSRLRTQRCFISSTYWRGGTRETWCENILRVHTAVDRSTAVSTFSIYLHSTPHTPTTPELMNAPLLRAHTAAELTRVAGIKYCGTAVVALILKRSANTAQSKARSVYGRRDTHWFLGAPGDLTSTPLSRVCADAVVPRCVA